MLFLNISVVIAAMLSTFQAIKAEHFVPIVLWHGMGDSCCFDFSLGAFQKKLNETLPGVYILSLRIGPSVISDVENGYFMHPDKQVEEACRIIQSDPNLVGGYNAIGFSQGAQFLRALAQRCPNPPIYNLISLGGQHQGVYGLPHCGSLSHPSCDYVRRLLNHAAYLGWVQDFLVQATYWHDPLNEQKYKEYSTFLADINNEYSINQTYIDNLNALGHFVMVKFLNDSMVQPVESEWFGFYTPGQSIETQLLQDSDLYMSDRLGLQMMDLNAKLRFLQAEGDHLQFTWEWFSENIIDEYLRYGF